MYEQCDVLLFPSKLETWGLPISEFKNYKKPMLVADLDYAKETVGTYNQVKFLDPENPEDWAKVMQKIILNKDVEYQNHEAISVPEPKAEDWHKLFEILLKL